MRLRLCALATASLLACRSPVAPEPLGTRLSAWTPADADRLGDEMSQSLRGHSYRLVVADSTLWDCVWRDSHGDFIPMPPVPAVDFQASVVLVAVSGFDGDITIDSVVQFERGARAYVTNYASCNNLAMNWIAFQMVRAPRTTISGWHTEDGGRRCA